MIYASRQVREAMKMIPGSDSSLLVVFGDIISAEINGRVIALFHAIQERRDPRIRNLHPAYASLLIDFDPLLVTHEEVASVVQQLTNEARTAVDESSRTVTIPVCYDPEFGPDLADVSRHARLAPEEVVRLHSSSTYVVYFLGFSPGFAYLGGLPEALHTPRLGTPRTSIVAGSVGIAGGQTGIYPFNSPGGWRLIGRTPLCMFDPEAATPARLQPGDRLKFSPIDGATFAKMKNAEEEQPA